MIDLKPPAWHEAYDDAIGACTSWARVREMHDDEPGRLAALECARRISIEKAFWERRANPVALVTTHAIRQASTMLVEHDDTVLCVWDRNYHGWTLPGGKVEPGETPLQTALRELTEETGVVYPETVEAPVFAFSGPSLTGWTVYVLRAVFHPVFLTARQKERGSPVAWLPRTELGYSPFRSFYQKMFIALGLDE